MAPFSLLHAALLCAVFSAIQVQAHGIASALVVFPTGTFYQGYNPSYQYAKPAPVVVGWSTPDDLQNTFVPPTSYSKPDIVCHLGATPAGAEAPVNAGDVLEIQWTPWPASHKGPVIDYLANCNGPCTNVDKTQLKFFKIDEVGLVDNAADIWGATQLINNNNSWLVRIPTDIAPGNYVLRHEIIALHAAGQTNGAQNYPFCFSLAISSDGTNNPDGVPAEQFYSASDLGVVYDLFKNGRSAYQIPGPALYSGALSVAQSKAGALKATASGIASLVFTPKSTTAVVAPVPTSSSRSSSTSVTVKPTGAKTSTVFITTATTVHTQVKVTVTTTLMKVARRTDVPEN